MNSNQNPNRRRLVLLALIWAALLVGLILALVISKSGENTRNPDNTAVESQKTTVEASASAPVPNSLALRFTSSGRLPTKLQGMELGMSIDQAKAQNSTLTVSGTSSLVVGESPQGYSLLLDFENGRLIDITATVSGHGMSSSDAALFDRNAQNQLGKPDAVVYGGQRATHWVWIDGDVRISYQDVGLFNGYSITMMMDVYPEELKVEAAHVHGDVRQEMVAQLRHDWGDGTEQPVIKELPRGFEDVKLGMAPWQVRAAMPGIEINSTSEHEASGQLTSASTTTSMDFWDNQVMSLFRSWHVSLDQLHKMPSQLIDELGTPSGRDPEDNLDTIVWDDRNTEITYMLSTGGPEKGQVQVWFQDVEMNKAKAVADMAKNPQQSEPIPENHSFF